jgi:2-alkenal reductase
MRYGQHIDFARQATCSLLVQAGEGNSIVSGRDLNNTGASRFEALVYALVQRTSINLGDTGLHPQRTTIMDSNAIVPVHRPMMMFSFICTLLLATIVWTGNPDRAAASADAFDSPLSPASQSDPISVVDLVEEVNPAVVTVYNLTILEDAFGQEQFVPQGTGTGFVIDEEGYIVTNWHVVFGGSEFAVAMFDGTFVDAELIGTDPRDDLAVVKIDPDDVLEVVTLGDSDELQPGEPVVAIGSPLGTFTNTVTAGVVSGLNRDDFGELFSNCQNYSNLIQHDAAINPGNSGGPLFNLEGEVIGVNTLGLPESMDGIPLQGLFFSVPSNLVEVVAQQMIEDGRVSVPYLGIQQIFIDPAMAAANDLDISGGIYVEGVVANTPAEDSGLLEGDIILQIDGRQISLDQGLPAILLDYQPGDTVELTFLRLEGNGAVEMTVELTFGNLPDEVLEACPVSG